MTGLRDGQPARDQACAHLPSTGWYLPAPCAEPRRLVGNRWLIADPARAADARGRLDVIAHSSAISLDGYLHPGSAGQPARERLEQIAKGQRTGEAVTGLAKDAAASDTIAAATQASLRAVVQAATDAVIAVARDQGSAASL